MKLPSGAFVTKNTPIYPNSNFTWGEATKNCRRQLENLVINGRLIISALQIEKNIVLTAKSMDRYRAIDLAIVPSKLLPGIVLHRLMPVSADLRIHATSSAMLSIGLVITYHRKRSHSQCG